MAQLTVIAPTTSAVTTQAAADVSNYQWGALSADLAGAEEVDIYTLVGPTWKLATDLSGNAKKLTASIPKIVMEGGIRYGVLKDATVASVGVYLDLGPGLNS